MADELLHSDNLYYWKKPYPWGDRQWTTCRWTLLTNGTLQWDTYKRKGTVNICDAYEQIRLCCVDEKEFFNGVPCDVEMVPYLLALPMSTVSSAGQTDSRQRCFAVSNLDNLRIWIRAFARVLQAEDTFSEMLRRARKEKAIAGKRRSFEAELLVEGWKKLIEALRDIDAVERQEEHIAQTEIQYVNSGFLWAMAVAVQDR